MRAIVEVVGVPRLLPSTLPFFKGEENSIESYSAGINKRTRTLSEHALAMKSYNGTRDSINALFRSHASLNGRDYICEDEINLANLLRPHINDVFVPHKSKVLVYLKQGLTQTEIVRRLELGKSMQSRISQWKKGFEEDGLLDRSK